MNHSISLPFSLLFLLLLILFLSSFFPSHADVQEDLFSSCEPFDCGKIKGISYPFREKSQPEHCGLPDFVLDCKLDNGSFMLDLSPQRFHVLDIKQEDRVLTVARIDLWDSTCPEKFSNTTLNFSLFHYTEKDKNTTLLYDCDSSELSGIFSFPCAVNNVPGKAYFVPRTDLESPELPWPSCNISVVVPVTEEAVNRYIRGLDDLHKVIEGGFEVGWHIMFEKECGRCNDSGGRCGHNVATKEFMCLCPPGIQSYDGWKTCGTTHSEWEPPADQALAPAVTPKSSSGGRDWRLKTAIGAAGGVAGVILMCVVFFIHMRRKRKQKAPTSLLSRDISSDISSGKDLEKGSTYFGVHLFTYEELVEATNNFDSSKELGDGGFGTVYYGKLHDGRVVAVKRLYESNYRRVEQFMNEIGILAHLRHNNLVSLYGCTSRHSHELLLVYEYIPNGTVADHLHGQRAKPGALPWAIRLNIAIETASALTYLHASEVVHRDVKTNNILLDNNFCVKVADFGLSRLFPMHMTHVSTAPQGTPGYVDPEYHQCYQLTSKSDVFSFGVVLMELVSSMPAVDITRHRHDINLSTMAMNRIQNHTLHEIVDPSLGFDTDSRVRKMITSVAELAFQCLQHEKDMRPNMADVLEELKAIQTRDYSMERAEKIETAADDAVLLKSGPQPFSPDSVTINWTSRATTPNASG